MKKLVVIAVLTLGLGSKAGAFVDLGNGQVMLEYGDSYGSVGAAYDVNYYNLGFYNGVNPDEVVVQPGQVINIGYTSGQEYYYGEQTYVEPTYVEPTYYTEPSCTEPTYYTEPSYTEPAYYTEPSYTEPAYYQEPSYTAEPTYTTIGKSYVYTGYGDNSGYNADRACQLNNEIIIPAGGTYAASAYIGTGGYDMGFVDSTCLDGNGGTFQAPGGGICGVTTAIHMAGKSAGLTVVQANAHNNGDGTTGVGYATAEDQASYNYGTSDLVMVNPYDHAVKLTCQYSGGAISATWSEEQ